LFLRRLLALYGERNVNARRPDRTTRFTHDQDFLARGGALWACTPCVKSRGCTQEDLIDGVVVTGRARCTS
jgi:hypothetical protein